MSWARIDDTFADHPKVLDLSLDAVGLWTLALTWAHRNTVGTDWQGVVPTGQVTRLALSKARKLTALLVDAGLWEPVAGGVLIHDFADYLESAKRITPGTPADLSAKRREAGRRGGKAAQQAKQTGSKLLEQTEQTPSKPDEQTEQVLSASEQVAVSPVVASNEATNPNPLPTALARKSEQTAATLIAEWVDHCEATPVARVKGQVAKVVGEMLAEGQPYDVVRRGLVRWHDKRLNPSALPSVVHEVAQGPPTAPARPSNVSAHLALAQSLDAGATR